MAHGNRSGPATAEPGGLERRNVGRCCIINRFGALHRITNRTDCPWLARVSAFAATLMAASLTGRSLSARPRRRHNSEPILAGRKFTPPMQAARLNWARGAATKRLARRELVVTADRGPQHRQPRRSPAGFRLDESLGADKGGSVLTWPAASPTARPAAGQEIH